MRQKGYAPGGPEKRSRTENPPYREQVWQKAWWVNGGRRRTASLRVLSVRGDVSCSSHSQTRPAGYKTVSRVWLSNCPKQPIARELQLGVAQEMVDWTRAREWALLAILTAYSELETQE